MSAVVAPEILQRSHAAGLPVALWAAGSASTPAEVDRLRASAEEAISSIRAFLKITLAESIGEGFDPTIDLGNMTPEAQATYEEALNSALDVVRNSRALYEGRAFDRFARLVDVHAADLAPSFRRARSDFVSYCREAEKVFIMFGAGSDDEARAIDIIPHVA